jgi:bacillithiol system protein YtxJ
MMDAAMSNELVELHTLEDLDRLLDEPSGAPVLIYKHSITCGTSGMALEEIGDLAAGPSIGARIGVVMVQPARDVSNDIARRFGVRHESPQVLLVQAGKVVWQASHYRVTAESISAALARAGVSVGS